MRQLTQGIIVSLQGKSMETSLELAIDIKNAGAVAIRTDKPLKIDLPIIGLNKNRVKDIYKEPYITNTIDDIDKVSLWSDYVAIDYRSINPDLKEISKHCKTNNIPVIADIRNYNDWLNIKENDLYFTFVATTFSIFDKGKKANTQLVKDLSSEIPGKVIAEGGYKNHYLVRTAYQNGALAVCIGMAITDVYKLTKQFTKIDPSEKNRYDKS